MQDQCISKVTHCPLHWWDCDRLSEKCGSFAEVWLAAFQVNPDRRLGSNGAREIRHHPWFERMDWQMLAAKKLKAPIVPELSSLTDTSNFESFDSQVKPPPPNQRNDRNIWQLWEWVDTTGLAIHTKWSKPLDHPFHNLNVCYQSLADARGMHWMRVSNIFQRINTGSSIVWWSTTTALSTWFAIQITLQSRITLQLISFEHANMQRQVQT